MLHISIYPTGYPHALHYTRCMHVTHCTFHQPKFPMVKLTTLHEMGRIRVVICLFQGGLCSLSALLSLFSFLQFILVLYYCV